MSKKTSKKCKCRCGNPGAVPSRDYGVLGSPCVEVDRTEEAKAHLKGLKFGDKIYVPCCKRAPRLVYFCGVKDSSAVWVPKPIKREDFMDAYLSGAVSMTTYWNCFRTRAAYIKEQIASWKRSVKYATDEKKKVEQGAARCRRELKRWEAKLKKEKK